MKVGIIFAMKKEADSFLKRFESKKLNTVHGIEYYEINDNLTVCIGGVGKVNTAISATILHERYNPDIVINGGVAGCLTDLPVGTVIVPKYCVQHDVDTTVAGDPIGLVSTVNVREFNTYNPEETSLVISNNGFESAYGAVATGDWFGKDFERAHFIMNEFNAVVCDMEAAAVCHVCFRYGTKPVIIKVVSDHLFSENQDEEYIKGVPIASKTLDEAIYSLLNNYINQ